MGISSDAMLFYGYVWEDEVDEDTIPEAASEIYGKDEPVLVGHHGSSEWNVPYVYIQKSETTAWRGGPKLISNVLSYEADESEWQQQLSAFVAHHNIDLTEAKGPGWFLASYMG